jgi:UDP-N-acetylglucosamine 4,6-dehydratase
MLVSVLKYLLRLSRYQKRAALAVGDLILLHFSLWLAMSLRFGVLYMAPTWRVFFLLAAVPFFASAAFFYAGLYRHVTRHFGSVGVQLIAVGASTSALALGLGAFLVGAEGVPRTVLLLYPIFGTILLWGSRRTLQFFITLSGQTLPPPVKPWELRNCPASAPVRQL